ncbi:hypothetical protein VTL71DRAFT_12901 [Oculimacula yallundae]|uniref:BTB domain-containing protein n=1 Tax=Oculimacula yallundae TaxID=86028 RepID=A0ABR4CNT1_9HELO
MPIIYHEFDPDGDLLLLLGRPTKTTLEHVQPTGGIDPELAMSAYEQAIEGGTGVTIDLTMDIDDDSNEASEEEDEGTSEPVSTEEPVQEMHMLVSSKHLMTASPVFKAMLKKGHFKEGTKLTSGRSEVALDDDPPAAFKILMDILHFNARQVPRELDLKKFTNLAVLVDKYQLLEPVELFAARWLKDLQDTPSIFMSDTHRILCIAWVFRSVAHELLLKIIKILLVYNEGKIGAGIAHQFPIPGLLLETIESYRQEFISEALRNVDDLITKYVQRSPNGPIVCRGKYKDDTTKRRQTCDNAMSGSLMASLIFEELFPLPIAPYHDLSVFDTISKVVKIKLSAVCDLWDNPEETWTDGKGPKSSGHGHMKKIKGAIDLLKARVDGTDILEVTALMSSPSSALHSTRTY